MRKFLYLIPVCCLLFATNQVKADTAIEAVKARQQIMKSYGKSMRVLASMMRGAIDYNANDLINAASIIGNNSGEVFLQHFPEGSIVGDSESSPNIWTDWQHFSKLATEIGIYAEGLALAANNPRGNGEADLLMMEDADRLNPQKLGELSPDAAFSLIAKSCGSCHKPFRVKK